MEDEMLELLFPDSYPSANQSEFMSIQDCGGTHFNEWDFDEEEEN
jgi:hypothetical protein